MVCIDASLVGAWFLPEELSDKAVLLRRRLRSAGEQLIAPTLVVPEVTDILRKAVYRQRIEAEVGQELYDLFKALPIRLTQDRELSDSAWSWAKLVNAPRLYDMYYLALAEQEGCDLWTADGKLGRLVGDRSRRIRYVGDLSDVS